MHQCMKKSKGKAQELEVGVSVENDAQWKQKEKVLEAATGGVL